MSDSIAKRILDNLVSELSGITTANGYDNDVALVVKDVLVWDEVPTEKFPALFVMGVTETPEEHGTQVYRVSFEVLILAYVYAIENRSDAVESLIRDVKLKLLEDRGRGETSVTTRLGETRRFYGIEEPANFFEMDVQVEYHHTVDNP